MSLPLKEKHCDIRHPIKCYYFDTYERCKLGKYCMYMHSESEESKLKNYIVRLNSEIVALKNKTKNSNISYPLLKILMTQRMLKSLIQKLHLILICHYKH